MPADVEGGKRLLEALCPVEALANPRLQLFQHDRGPDILLSPRDHREIGWLNPLSTSYERKGAREDLVIVAIGAAEADPFEGVKELDTAGSLAFPDPSDREVVLVRRVFG